MNHCACHMHKFFGSVARILVLDNCKTAVVHNAGWKDQQINETYKEMAKHYGTAIIPARCRCLASNAFFKNNV